MPKFFRSPKEKYDDQAGPDSMDCAMTEKPCNELATIISTGDAHGRNETSDETAGHVASWMPQSLGFSDVIAAERIGKGYMPFDAPLFAFDKGPTIGVDRSWSLVHERDRPSSPGLGHDSFSPNRCMPSPPLLRSLRTAHTIVKRPAILRSSHPSIELLGQMLKSYPLMMMRHHKLPPFLHPRFVEGGLHWDGEDLEPLTNCVNLVYMLGAGVTGGAKLFWRNVSMECERFVARVGNPS
jgi:hypothetical protein